MRVLVTRPLEDVGPLVAALEARGHTALVEPMLSIERRADVALPLPLEGVQALLFTSANGVRAFADLAPERDLPVFAVGDASATAARDAGFTAVESAGGDVADLARLVAERLDSDDGALFHPAASQLAGDLQGALEDAGFTLRRAALYEAQPAVELSPALRRTLAEGGLEAAVFFSPRTARTFVSLVENADLGAVCARLQAVCLSEAVAARLNALAWARVLVAARPEQDAVLARLDEAATHIPDSVLPPPDGQLDAPDVIAAFGGIRPMASKLGVAVSTVQGWRERGSIPAARNAQIAAAAKSQGVRLDPAPDLPPVAPETAPKTTPKTTTPKETTLPPRESQARPAAAAAPSPEPSAPEMSGHIAAPSARSWGAGALGIAVVAAVVAGAGLALVGRDVWLAEPPPTTAATPVVDTAAMASLETRLAAVENNNRDQADIAQIEDEMSAIQNRLDGLAADVATDSPSADTAAQSALISDVQSQLQTLVGRIDALDKKVDDVQGQLENIAVANAAPTPNVGALAAGDVALSLVVAQLRDAVRGSAPFTPELQAVLDLVTSPGFAGGSDLVDALTPLIPLAETGVPVLATLRADFPGVARAIVGQGLGAGGDDWLTGIKRRVSGLISVRPVGQVVGDGPEAIAARAEAALGDDDLAGAVRELSALADPAAGAARDWLAAAKTRLAVRTALNQLARGLIVRLDASSE